MIFPHYVWKNYANCVDVTNLQYISIFEVLPNIHLDGILSWNIWNWLSLRMWRIAAIDLKEQSLEFEFIHCS